MGKYYEALSRGVEQRSLDSMEAGGTPAGKPLQAPKSAAPLVVLPVFREVPAAIARGEQIRRLAETLAPAAARSPMRLLVSGCRPGDGASTIATALAIDLSQRLALRTLLLDAHLSRPGLERLLPAPGPVPLSAPSSSPIRSRPTGWPRLELGVCAAIDEPSSEFFESLDDNLTEYQAVIIDLGVVRLDPRMLPVARPSDPIVLVVRYGHTERKELATTVAALRSAERAPAGAILSGVNLPPPGRLRRLMHI